MSSAPGKGGRTARPKRPARCYADSGCGTGGGAQLFGARGSSPSDACPTLPPGTVPRKRCRLPAAPPRRGGCGATPRFEAPAVDPDVDPDDGFLAANLSPGPLPWGGKPGERTPSARNVGLPDTGSGWAAIGRGWRQMVLLGASNRHSLLIGFNPLPPGLQSSTFIFGNLGKVGFPTAIQQEVQRRPAAAGSDLDGTLAGPRSRVIPDLPRGGPRDS